MQPNPQGQPPRRPTRAPVGAPKPNAARPQQPAAQPRPTTSYRNDPPPGMGGGEPGYAPQAYEAQQGQPAQYANSHYAQGQTQPYLPPSGQGIQTFNGKAWGGIGIGALLVIGGIVATMVSYDSAGPGGRYTIWWGPVVFGGISLLGGIGALFKKS